MKDLDSTTQHVVLEKFISHPLFNNMFFDYLTNLQNVKQNHEVLSNKKVKIIYKTFSRSKEV
jgi:hypothetical protein